jgi:hypothetical protein
VPVERARRSGEVSHRNYLRALMRRAFSEEAILENASIIVLTKGQMRGLRAAIKRLGMR